MACLRIFSYLPNPRLYKATIAARFSGAAIEILGAKPQELPGWLWDYEARPLREGDRESPEMASWARTAKRGFQGTLFKTDRVLRVIKFATIFERRFRGAALQSDVLAAEQPGREDACVRIIGNLVVTAIDNDGDDGLERLAVELDIGDTPDRYTRH